MTGDFKAQGELLAKANKANQELSKKVDAAGKAEAKAKSELSKVKKDLEAVQKEAGEFQSAK